MAVWGFINVFAAPAPTNKTELLPMVIIQFLYNFIVMLLSYFCMNSENTDWQFSIKFVAPLSVYAFNMYRDGAN
jgi:hypothetical protein